MSNIEHKNILVCMETLSKKYDFVIEPVPDLPEEIGRSFLRGEDLKGWGFCFTASVKDRIIYVPEALVYEGLGEDNWIAAAAFCHEVGHIIMHGGTTIFTDRLLTIEAEAWLEGIELLDYYFPMEADERDDVDDFILLAINTYWNRRQIHGYSIPSAPSPWHTLITKQELNLNLATNLYERTDVTDE